MDQKRMSKRIFDMMGHIVKKELHPKNTVTFFSEVDCTAIESLRARYFKADGVKPSYTAFIIQAVAQAVKTHSYVNARIFPGLFQNYLHQFKNIDMAVANEKDLPGAEFFAFLDAIRNVDTLSVLEIHQQLHALARSDESNNKQLKDFLNLVRTFPSWLGKHFVTLPAFFPKLWEKYRGAGIVISSPAKYGVDCVSATWTHPIGVSFGLVKKKPMVKDDEIQPVLSFTLTLNFDRRIIAGAPAARFFNQIVQNLTTPAFSLEDSVESKKSPLFVQPMNCA